MIAFLCKYLGIESSPVSHTGRLVSALGNVPERYYSSVEYGDDWSVRQIVDESKNPDPDRDMVVYKVVAGAELKTSGVVTRTGFAR
jgi:hypothetical protein